ncbi:hypothetical protein P170DRAFT_504782 [Aspergillus steynii IBT 23096]|uniref:C2H2-type domain-containing protein n=1 Tax=Aspergillus steynii IBT 23096 TaxID=1392250 RepID=A0A2I2GM03_9EURO|nr:uncharacterized protein P170DRAFT_504782 [Aspergillus steynii IBT 23096]PLB53904.1 hypothetical protein P170DRAFT_504782 [Aspergillus steynii IBT 23096]
MNKPVSFKIRYFPHCIFSNKPDFYLDHEQSTRRSYQCPQCSARFLRSDLRKRHIRNCHPLTDAQSTPTASLWQTALENQLPLPSFESTSPPVDLGSLPIPDRGAGSSDSSHPPFEIPSSSHGSSFAKELLCSDAYFKYFHPGFPIIHKPSFNPNTCPEALLKAISAIGTLYATGDGKIAHSRASFDTGLQSLDTYIQSDPTRVQDPWVIPAYLILESFGMYCCDDQLFVKAQNIHRRLVDSVRELQMTRESQISHADVESDDGRRELSALDDASIPLATRWNSFVHAELRKRTIYCLYLLDSQFAIICNVRPLMSALEIKYDLPCPDELWDAETAEDWDVLRRQQFSSFNDQDDENGVGGRPPQGTFYESTQRLLHHGSRRMSSSLRLLWSSPFTALILVTQLQMMSRDLVHANCLLARPLSSQTPLSVLLDHQYGQIAQALRNILDLTPRGNPLYSRPGDSPVMEEVPANPGHTALWHSFWIMWHYTSITLTHSDSLLVTGTVESNLPAAIATAGFLAKPRDKKNRDIYEDRDVFRLLNDLEPTIPEIAFTQAKDNHLPVDAEHPFTTFLGFKICLVGWRVVRLMVGKATGDARASHDGKCSSTPSTVYQHSPAEYILRRICSRLATCTANIMHDTMGSEGRPFDSYETDYMNWAARTFAERKVWPVGKWQSAIIAESLGSTPVGNANAGVSLMVPSPSQIPSPGQCGLQLATELGLTDLGISDSMWMGDGMG